MESDLRTACLVSFAEYQWKYKLSTEEAHRIITENQGDINAAKIDIKRRYNMKQYPFTNLNVEEGNRTKRSLPSDYLLPIDHSKTKEHARKKKKRHEHGKTPEEGHIKKEWINPYREEAIEPETVEISSDSSSGEDNQEEECREALREEEEMVRRDNVTAIISQVLQDKLEYNEPIGWIERLNATLGVDHEMDTIIEQVVNSFVQYCMASTNVKSDPYITHELGIEVICHISCLAPTLVNSDKMEIPLKQINKTLAERQRNAEIAIMALQSSKYAAPDNNQLEENKETKHLPSAKKIIDSLNGLLEILADRSNVYNNSLHSFNERENALKLEMHDIKEALTKHMIYCKQCIEENQMRRKVCISKRSQSSSKLQQYIAMKKRDLETVAEDTEVHMQAAIDVLTSPSTPILELVNELHRTKEELLHLQNTKYIYEYLRQFLNYLHKLFEWVYAKRIISLAEAKEEFLSKQMEIHEITVQKIEDIRPYLTHSIYAQIHFEKERYKFTNKRLQYHENELVTAQEYFGDTAKQIIYECKQKIAETEKLEKQIDNDVKALGEVQIKLFNKCSAAMEVNGIEALKGAYEELLEKLDEEDKERFGGFAMEILGIREKKYVSFPKYAENGINNQEDHHDIQMESVSEDKHNDNSSTDSTELGTVSETENNTVQPEKNQELQEGASEELLESVQKDENGPHESMGEDIEDLDSNVQIPHRFHVGDTVYTRFCFGDVTGGVYRGRVEAILPNFRYKVHYDDDSIYTVDESNCCSEEEINEESNEGVTDGGNDASCLVM